MRDANEIRRLLENAISNGEWFEIIYYGGSNPGARRKIVPIAVFADRVRARCYTSNAVKPFLLEKIEILEDDKQAEGIQVWGLQTARPIDRFADVRDVHTEYKTALADLGWRVELLEHPYGWDICLFGIFKNGKPRKTPTHVLSFNHTAYDSVVTPDGGTENVNLRPRTRPWVFRSIAYKNYSQPVAEFLKASGMPQ